MVIVMCGRSVARLQRLQLEPRETDVPSCNCLFQFQQGQIGDNYHLRTTLRILSFDTQELWIVTQVYSGSPVLGMQLVLERGEETRAGWEQSFSHWAVEGALLPLGLN